MKSKPNPLFHMLAAAMAGMTITTTAHAATYNWTGSTDSDFQTASNWVENAWDQWGDYRFGSSVTNGTVNVNNGFGWGPVYLDSGLTSDIVIGGPQPIIMAANWGAVATMTIAPDSQNLTINNGYQSNGAVTWDVGANRTLTFNNILSDFTPHGVASLVKQGAGTAVLTGGNTYTGTTTVSGGTLVLARSSWTFENVNRGGVTVTGATLRADNSVANHLNGLTLNGGTVDAVNSSGNGDWGNFFLTGDVTATGTSYLNADIALRKTNVDFNVSSGGTLNVGGPLHNGAFFGIYSGAPSTISKSGDGTMALTATNSYTGDTTVNAGTLSLGNGTNNSNPSDGATVSIAFGAVVDLNFLGTNSDVVGKLIIDGETMPAGVYDATSATPLPYRDYFTGSGSLTVLEQSGTWTSTASGNWGTSSNWLSNTIATGAGKTATFSAGTGSENITVTLDTSRQIGNLAFSNATYTLAGGNTLTLDSTSTTPAISVASGLNATITSKLGGSVGLEKNGPGTLTLIAGSGDNYAGVYNHNISGGLNITEGTVEFASQYIRMGSITIDTGATLRTTIPWATGSSNDFGLGGRSAGSFTVEAGGTLTSTTLANAFIEGLTLNGGSVTAPGVTSGDWGAFIIASTVTAGGDATSTISAELALAGNQTFDVLTGSSLDITGVIHNRAGTAGAITKEGAGPLTLSGANIYSGNTVVNDGALNVTSAGSLRFYPTSNNTTNAVSGAASGTLSFLGTVDIDLSAADATDGSTWTLFDLASFTSPQTLTPAAVTSTLGAFTEAPAGTWKLPVTGAEWVFTEGDGKLAYNETANDYDTWKTANGVTGGKNDDDDPDGLTNFDEYAFGLDPTGGSEVNPITSQLNKSTKKFSYTRRATNLPNPALNYTVWFSNDLSTWTQDTGATEGTPVLNGEVETVEVTLSALPGDPLPAKLFIQVRAN